MKNFTTILKFELDNYFKSKSYMICTILICLLAAGIMFFPRIKESIKGDKDSKVETGVDKEDKEDVSPEDMTNMTLYDAAGINDMELLTGYFGGVNFIICNSVEEVKEKIEKEEAEAGFVINSLTQYDYYVYNKSMYNEDTYTFSEYMSMLVKKDYCNRNNLDLDEYMAVEYTQIDVNETVLGKDSASNYWYCYILVIIVFMLIIMYGVTIASGVTNEKSNRSIEILVTSTSSTALLFGKVFAGAIASIFQAGLIAFGLLGSYQFNKEYWGENISLFLDIPSDVLIVFAIFGIGGFLFYAFMYGALGALVSKIEDLNKSSGIAQMLVMIVYMVVLMQLQNPDGIIMKVCSFLPVSSYSAMFTRVAMGSVATWEVVVSAVLLYASVVLMGIIGGKIFRNSTLRYGNPIKISNALKGLNKKD